MERRGAEVLPVPARGGRVDLRRLLTRLGEEGLHSVLVEGGAELAGSLLRAGLVDEICWFSAPLLIGGDGLAMIGPLGATRMDQALRLTDMSVQMVGPDALHVARVQHDG